MLPPGILICCTGHFWRGSLCLFGFCLLVFSVSNFCPDTSGRRWSLVWVRLFSRAVGREGRCRQMSLACAVSTHSILAVLGLLLLTAGVWHCLGSRLLYRELALHCVWFQFSGTPQNRRVDLACVLCLPQAEQLRQPGARPAHSPRVWCTLSPPWSQPQFPRVPVGCALCLFWGAGL